MPSRKPIQVRISRRQKNRREGLTTTNLIAKEGLGSKDHEEQCDEDGDAVGGE